MLKVVNDCPEGQADEFALSLDDRARVGARRMLAAALEVEVNTYVERFQGERDSKGRALVVGNGKARSRRVTVGSGTMQSAAPRVNDRRVDGDRERKRFTSAILPP